MDDEVDHMGIGCVRRITMLVVMLGVAACAGHQRLPETAGSAFDGAWTVKWCGDETAEADCAGLTAYLIQSGTDVCGTHLGWDARGNRFDEGETPSITGTVAAGMATVYVRSARNHARWRVQLVPTPAGLRWVTVAEIEAGANGEPALVAQEDMLTRARDAASVEILEAVRTACAGHRATGAPALGPIPARHLRVTGGPHGTYRIHVSDAAGREVQVIEGQVGDPPYDAVDKLTLEDFTGDGLPDILARGLSVGASALTSESIYVYDAATDRFMDAEAFEYEGEVSKTRTGCIVVEHRNPDNITYSRDPYCWKGRWVVDQGAGGEPAIEVRR